MQKDRGEDRRALGSRPAPAEPAPPRGLLLADGDGAFRRVGLEETLRRLAALPIDVGRAEPAREEGLDAVGSKRVGHGGRD